MKLNLVSILPLFAAAVSAGTCGTQTCGPDTPCCVKGFCNRNAQYCMPFDCEPANSHASTSCWPAIDCADSSVDFGQPGAFANIADYTTNDPGVAKFVSKFEPSNAKVTNGQMELALVKQGEKGFGATVISTRAIQYGTVAAVVKSGCTSGGVVSSMIIRNDQVGDEIDFEFVGGDIATVQSNYYWHNELDYTKMVKSQVVSDTTQNFHTYKIDWTPDKIVWSVDDNAFRTVERKYTWDAATNSFKFPDSKAYVSFSIWDGGSGAEGTRAWAGGYVDWAKQPTFNMAVKSVTIGCYKANATAKA
ncbi:putative glycosidase CRH2 [Linderina macrospora]|uniref:Glycosidase CRH2 n=1 Tax=Linderina macrospora TaxID=4868 RepID=A0ACC1IYA7_9FUNG|nr:putative glycosidase CRH2 [Linderina macrospora]